MSYVNTIKGALTPGAVQIISEMMKGNGRHIHRCDVGNMAAILAGSSSLSTTGSSRVVYARTVRCIPETTESRAGEEIPQARFNIRIASVL